MNLTYSKQSIIEEYDLAARFNEEYQQLKWGSYESMMNRFSLVMRETPFNNVSDWLDIGCGTGVFQAIVSENATHVSGLGIDLNTRFITKALNKNIKRIDFKTTDFMDLHDLKFDLITCLGVIQKTNFTLSEFFYHAASLLHSKGKLFVDTKNIGWNRFNDPDFVPEPIHQWFSIQQLRGALQLSELEEVKLFGFLPAENKLVAPEDSHTIVLIVQKP